MFFFVICLTYFSPSLFLAPHETSLLSLSLCVAPHTVRYRMKKKFPKSENLPF